LRLQIDGSGNIDKNQMVVGPYRVFPGRLSVNKNKNKSKIKKFISTKLNI
jgi:hypothetical protein